MAAGKPNLQIPAIPTFSFLKHNSHPTEDGLDIVDASEPMAALHRGQVTSNAFIVPHVSSEHDRKRMFVCYLAAQALTTKQIADEADLAESTVRDILKDPDAAAFVAETMAHNCSVSMEKRIKEDADFALLQLRQLLIDAIASKKIDVVRKLAKDMADRHYGTPTSRVEHTKIDPDKMSDEELLRIAKSGSESQS